MDKPQPGGLLSPDLCAICVVIVLLILLIAPVLIIFSIRRYNRSLDEHQPP
jgi:hypothetical protein